MSKQDKGVGTPGGTQPKFDDKPSRMGTPPKPGK
jgi:hypothetical protein